MAARARAPTWWWRGPAPRSHAPTSRTLLRDGPAEMPVRLSDETYLCRREGRLGLFSRGMGRPRRPAHKPNSGVQYCLFCERRFSSLTHSPTLTLENAAFPRSRPLLGSRAYAGAYAYAAPQHRPSLRAPRLSHQPPCPLAGGRLGSLPRQLEAAAVKPPQDSPAALRAQVECRRHFAFLPDLLG